MTEYSKTRCATQRCIDDIKKYGEHYHGVYDGKETDSYEAICERCGGKLIDGEWVHKCKACGKTVQPGELTGLFVPHKCSECEEKVAKADISRGAVCSMCRKPYSRCCC
jgi:hypothetical protein